MKKPVHAWMAACASALLLAAGAAGAASDADIDCAKGTVASSGTTSATGAAKHRHTTSRTRQVASDPYTLHAAFPQCADRTDRSERAECVRGAWEARYGTPGEPGTAVASSSTRRPC